MHRSRTAPPRARLAGGIYLLYFVAAFTVLGLSTTHHHAAARALNILDNLLYIALTLLLYFIFRHAGPRLAAAAVAFSLLGCAANVFGPFHLRSVHLHPLLFFALFMVLLGILIVRSALLPAAIGYGLMLAAIAWLACLLPGFPPRLLVYVEALGILAEAALMLSLLVRGLPQDRWIASLRHARPTPQTPMR